MPENVLKGVNWMHALETLENEILKHLYDLGIIGLHGGWERQ